MNAKNDEAWAEDARFDRLVDGELSPEEYRQLLSSLDAEPDGWRRCAMAFLEAQTLRTTLGAMLVESERDVVSSPTAEPLHDRTANRTLRSWLSLALTVLLAFGLGSLASLLMLQLRNGGGTENQVAQPQNSETNSPRDSLAKNKSPKSFSLKDAVDSRNMKLVVDVPAVGQREVEIPVYDSRQTTPAEVWQSNPLFSEDLVRELRSRGHDVLRSRSLLPVPLDDGRSVVVPMEEIQITPVGRRVF